MTPLERIVLQRAEEQCRAQDMKIPKCEFCGATLRGSRSHKAPGERICAKCEGGGRSERAPRGRLDAG